VKPSQASVPPHAAVPSLPLWQSWQYGRSMRPAGHCEAISGQCPAARSGALAQSAAAAAAPSAPARIAGQCNAIAG
jgi:hypothetical protein